MLQQIQPPNYGTMTAPMAQPREPGLLGPKISNDAAVHVLSYLSYQHGLSKIVQTHKMARDVIYALPYIGVSSDGVRRARERDCVQVGQVVRYLGSLHRPTLRDKWVLHWPLTPAVAQKKSCCCKDETVSQTVTIAPGFVGYLMGAALGFGTYSSMLPGCSGAASCVMGASVGLVCSHGLLVGGIFLGKWVVGKIFVSPEDRVTPYFETLAIEGPELDELIELLNSDATTFAGLNAPRQRVMLR